jgi:hypothetical protein
MSLASGSTAFYRMDLTDAYNGTKIERGVRMINQRQQVLCVSLAFSSLPSVVVSSAADIRWLACSGARFQFITGSRTRSPPPMRPTSSGGCTPSVSPPCLSRPHLDARSPCLPVSLSHRLLSATIAISDDKLTATLTLGGGTPPLLALARAA